MEGSEVTYLAKLLAIARVAGFFGTISKESSCSRPRQLSVMAVAGARLFTKLGTRRAGWSDTVQVPVMGDGRPVASLTQALGKVGKGAASR